MAEQQQGAEKQKVVEKISTKKRQRQNIKRRVANRAALSEFRSALRYFTELLATKDKNKLQAQLNSIFSLADKAVKTSLFKQNKANRIKSRLTAKLFAL